MIYVKKTHSESFLIGLSVGLLIRLLVRLSVGLFVRIFVGGEPGYLTGSQDRQDLSLILDVSTVPAYTPIMVLSKLILMFICSKLRLN